MNGMWSSGSQVHVELVSEAVIAASAPVSVVNAGRRAWASTGVSVSSGGPCGLFSVAGVGVRGREGGVSIGNSGELVGAPSSCPDPSTSPDPAPGPGPGLGCACEMGVGERRVKVKVGCEGVDVVVDDDDTYKTEAPDNSGWPKGKMSEPVPKGGVRVAA